MVCGEVKFAFENRAVRELKMATTRISKPLRKFAKDLSVEGGMGYGKAIAIGQTTRENDVLDWGVNGFRPGDGLVGVFAVIVEKVIVTGRVRFAADEGFEWFVIFGSGEGHFLKPGAAGA